MAKTKTSGSNGESSSLSIVKRNELVSLCVASEFYLVAPITENNLLYVIEKNHGVIYEQDITESYIHDHLGSSSPYEFEVHLSRHLSPFERKYQLAVIIGYLYSLKPLEKCSDKNVFLLNADENAWIAEDFALRLLTPMRGISIDLIKDREPISLSYFSKIFDVSLELSRKRLDDLDVMYIDHSAL